MRHNHLEEPIYDAPDTKSPAIEPARPPASSTHLLMRNNKPGKDLQQQCIYQCNQGYYLGTPPAIRYVECPKQLPRPAELGGRKNLHDKLRGRPDTSGQTPVHGQRRPSDALRSSPARLGPTVGPGGHNNFNNPTLHLEPFRSHTFPPNQHKRSLEEATSRSSWSRDPLTTEASCRAISDPTTKPSCGCAIARAAICRNPPKYNQRGRWART